MGMQLGASLVESQGLQRGARSRMMSNTGHLWVLEKPCILGVQLSLGVYWMP